MGTLGDESRGISYIINITTGYGLSDSPGMGRRGGTKTQSSQEQEWSRGIIVFVGNILVTLTASVVPIWKRYNEGDILHAVSQID